MVLAISCRIQKPAVTTEISRHDSVSSRVEENKRDTTAGVTISGGKSSSEDTLKYDPEITTPVIPDTIIRTVISGLNTPVNHLTTPLAESWAWVKNGKLFHEISQPDTTLWIRLDNAIRERNYYRDRYQSEKEKIISAPVVKGSWWNTLWVWSGRAVWTILIIGIAFFALKWFRKFTR